MLRSIVVSFAILAFLSTEACQTRKAPPEMSSTSIFGKLPDGREVYRYTLKNASGMTVQVINYGAAITSLMVPDRTGQIDDVVLGYDSLQGYINGTTYFGAIVGRYGNRIARGHFQLDGKEYQLATNDGANHLHGGKIGFNKVLWETQSFSSSGPEPSIQLQYVSRDGEEGYPGTVTLKVTYTVTAKDELRIQYEGTTDTPTILNPTNHSYFNLSGSLYNTILGHLLMIEAEGFTPVDKGLIPTGRIEPVAGTPMDFRTATVIGARINDPYEQLNLGRGYDHNWVLKSPAGSVRKAVDLYEPISGRALEVFTDQPGVQFYSGNFLDGKSVGKNNVWYQQRSGLCLETQAFPDSPNQPQFPSTTLRPGQIYRQTTIYRFSTR